MAPERDSVTRSGGAGERMNEPVTQETVARAVEGIGTAEQIRTNRIRVRAPPGEIREAIRRVQRMLVCDRLITISTVDTTTSIELLYHLIGPHRTIVSVSIELPREEPEIDTVSDLLPPAGLYERQIHDLFGVVFLGHPDLKRVILNDDWPPGEYPLRKDWKPDPHTFYGGMRGEGAG